MEAERRRREEEERRRREEAERLRREEEERRRRERELLYSRVPAKQAMLYYLRQLIGEASAYPNLVSDLAKPSFLFRQLSVLEKKTLSYLMSWQPPALAARKNVTSSTDESKMGAFPIDYQSQCSASSTHAQWWDRELSIELLPFPVWAAIDGPEPKRPAIVRLADDMVNRSQLTQYFSYHHALQLISKFAPSSQEAGLALAARDYAFWLDQRQQQYGLPKIFDMPACAAESALAESGLGAGPGSSNANDLLPFITSTTSLSLLPAGAFSSRADVLSARGAGNRKSVVSSALASTSSALADPGTPSWIIAIKTAILAQDWDTLYLYLPESMNIMPVTAFSRIMSRLGDVTNVTHEVADVAAEKGNQGLVAARPLAEMPIHEHAAAQGLESKEDSESASNSSVINNNSSDSSLTPIPSASAAVMPAVASTHSGTGLSSTGSTTATTTTTALSQQAAAAARSPANNPSPANPHGSAVGPSASMSVADGHITMSTPAAATAPTPVGAATAAGSSQKLDPGMERYQALRPCTMINFTITSYPLLEKIESRFAFFVSSSPSPRTVGFGFPTPVSVIPKTVACAHTAVQSALTPGCRFALVPALTDVSVVHLRTTFSAPAGQAYTVGYVLPPIDSPHTITNASMSCSASRFKSFTLPDLNPHAPAGSGCVALYCVGPCEVTLDLQYACMPQRLVYATEDKIVAMGGDSLAQDVASPGTVASPATTKNASSIVPFKSSLSTSSSSVASSPLYGNAPRIPHTPSSSAYAATTTTQSNSISVTASSTIAPGSKVPKFEDTFDHFRTLQGQTAPNFVSWVKSAGPLVQSVWDTVSSGASYGSTMGAGTVISNEATVLVAYTLLQHISNTMYLCPRLPEQTNVALAVMGASSHGSALHSSASHTPSQSLTNVAASETPLSSQPLHDGPSDLLAAASSSRFAGPIDGRLPAAAQTIVSVYLAALRLLRIPARAVAGWGFTLVQFLAPDAGWTTVDPCSMQPNLFGNIFPVVPLSHLGRPPLVDMTSVLAESEEGITVAEHTANATELFLTMIHGDPSVTSPEDVAKDLLAPELRKKLGKAATDLFTSLIMRGPFELERASMQVASTGDRSAIRVTSTAGLAVEWLLTWSHHRIVELRVELNLAHGQTARLTNTGAMGMAPSPASFRIPPEMAGPLGITVEVDGSLRVSSWEADARELRTWRKNAEAKGAAYNWESGGVMVAPRRAPQPRVIQGAGLFAWPTGGTAGPSSLVATTNTGMNTVVAANGASPGATATGSDIRNIPSIRSGTSNFVLGSNAGGNTTAAGLATSSGVNLSTTSNTVAAASLNSLRSSTMFTKVEGSWTFEDVVNSPGLARPLPPAMLRHYIPVDPAVT